MENMLINIPAMYADHHVQEVRRLLLEIAGIEDVYASSCFQTVEVTFERPKLILGRFDTRLESQPSPRAVSQTPKNRGRAAPAVDVP